MANILISKVIIFLHQLEICFLKEKKEAFIFEIVHSHLLFRLSLKLILNVFYCEGTIPGIFAVMVPVSIFCSMLILSTMWCFLQLRLGCVNPHWGQYLKS